MRYSSDGGYAEGGGEKECYAGYSDASRKTLPS